jgi:RNA exonuclease 4
VAIDCEFVKSGDEELLARISIVNDRGECLLDSYVKPEKQITDYLTSITGISYLHIKNAPKAAEVLEKAKKIMYNKILVGHTVWKDLEVCGLQNWKGWKTLVDISEFKEFKEKTGKLISLRNLSLKYLGRSIQEGRHSSVEDSLATIDLFKIRKMEMLKQCKVIL